MSEAKKNKAEVGKETTFDEKFMMEKMSSIEKCCKTIEESLSSISFTTATISQRMRMLSPTMGVMNPWGCDVVMNPMLANPVFSKEAEKRCHELLEMMQKNFDDRMKNLEKAYVEATDPEKIRDKLKAIDDEDATLLLKGDSTYVLNALNTILLTGVEVARILDKYDLVIDDVDDLEKSGHARNKLMNVVAEINKISSRWRRTSETSSSKSE